MIVLLTGILEQGLIYGIMALGLYITYSILHFPDLSVDGTFPLGAAVTAVLITRGVSPWLALIAAFFCGILGGLVTGLLHVRLKITDLLSGILVMTALYSVNLRIADGKSNLPIFNQPTIFNSGLAALLPPVLAPYTVLLIVFLLALLMKALLDWYMKTQSGTLLRAAGDNVQVVTAVARDAGAVKILGLALANGFVALSGSILCQQQRFFDVTMGTGTMVIGLASVIIGTSLFRKLRFPGATSRVLIGSILYKCCIAGAIALGFAASDMKLIQAVLFVIALVINHQLKKGGFRHAEH
ncbi:MAG: ABC transporter permease [Clostridiaceae bacterium]|nr:ABC transporter permease [Clostridiaceae bacterium]